MRMILKAGLFVAATTALIPMAQAQQPAVDQTPAEMSWQGDANLLIPAYVPTPPPRPTNLGEATRLRDRRQGVELARSDFSGAPATVAVDRRASTLQSKVWMTVGMGF